MGLFERSPNDPQRKELNPILKLSLELGPLAVFFFGNALATGSQIFFRLSQPSAAASSSAPRSSSSLRSSRSPSRWR